MRRPKDEDYVPQFTENISKDSIHEITNTSDYPEKQSSKKTSKIKDLLWAIPSTLLIIIFIVANLVNGFGLVRAIINASIKLGDGSFIKGLLYICFALFGLISIVRSTILLLEEDDHRFKHYWQFVLYLIAIVAGYIALTKFAYEFLLV